MRVATRTRARFKQGQSYNDSMQPGAPDRDLDPCCGVCGRQSAPAAHTAAPCIAEAWEALARPAMKNALLLRLCLRMQAHQRSRQPSASSASHHIAPPLPLLAQAQAHKARCAQRPPHCDHRLTATFTLLGLMLAAAAPPPSRHTHLAVCRGTSVRFCSGQGSTGVLLPPDASVLLMRRGMDDARLKMGKTVRPVE